MDEIAGFLDGPRARQAFLLRTRMAPPWSMRIEDRAPLTLVAVVEGDAWIVPDDGDAEHLAVGDLAIVRGPRPYVVADRPETPPQVVIHPGQHCSAPDGTDLGEALTLGLRAWGNSAVGSTSMITGTYGSAGELSERLLAALPDLAVLRAEDWRTPLLDLLAAELGTDAPGQQAMLDRLLDTTLIAALRAWFAHADSDPPAWYRARADPQVAAALGKLHDDPAHPWTVGSLAREVKLSRAALARRFHAAVGDPPMTYLANWRLALAADHLVADESTVTAVARRVGYTSPFTFSTAFKRRFGTSPTTHRQLARAHSASVIGARRDAG